MKTLIIAEKPSVAADIARALGGFEKKGDYFESDEAVISSAVGHLVELYMPEDFDKKLKRWSLQSLPIIPEKFKLKPIEDNEKRYKLLKDLLKREDVSAVVNACDAGREGELIFTYIYELSNCKKPYRRMWMTSMTQEAIRNAFNQLRTADEMRPLQEAARCRSEADWLIGINGTRAITTRMFGHRAGAVATVGRVQTPTLTLVVEREKEIRNFVPRTYWRIIGQFGISAGSYEGVYQRDDFKKNPADEHDRVDRLWDEAAARQIVEEALRQPHAVVSDERKRTTQGAPRLYDLTTLQREANNRFGLPAGKTLQIAQALYEKHKVLTYPRTDSRALPEDYGSHVVRVLQSLPDYLAEHAAPVIEKNWVRPTDKRVFNNAQVSDHFAIIPTEQAPKKLSPDEQKIYDMVARRFVAVFYPAAEYDVTTRTSTVGVHRFKTEGKVLVKPGWLAVYGKEEAATKDALPPLTRPDSAPPSGNAAAQPVTSVAPENAGQGLQTLDKGYARVEGIEANTEATKPPARYTEATLLAAMEGAGKLVDDEGLAEAMKEKGLGTPATRAQIIEHLIALKYMERQGRELVPTTKAEGLLEFLQAVGIETLTSPSLTGEWESKLRKIEDGHLTRETFMRGIADLTTQIVSRTREFNEEQAGSRVTDIISPTDGQPLVETLRAYRSQAGDFAIYKTIGNRKISEDEIKALLKDRLIGPLDGFRSKSGKPFSASLKLDEENKVKFVFGDSFGGAPGEGGENGSEGGAATVDLSTFPVVGACPKGKSGKCPCKEGQVRETPNAYLCENARNEPKCDFRMGRTLLGKTIPRDQFEKILNNGKTDLIQGFRSKRTNRLFSAYLVLKPDSTIGFEFEPRAPKGTKKAGGRRGAKAAAAKEPEPTAEESAG